MVYEFKFPDVGEGITEGELVKWRVKEGDKVKADDILANVETDKAVVEIPSPRAGTIAKLHVKEGETIKVGQVMVSIAEDGEKVAVDKEVAAPKEAAKPLEKKEDKKYFAGVVGFLEEAPEEDEAEVKEKEEVKKEEIKKPAEAKPAAQVAALPAVRKLAEELKVDISGLKGTGPEGRITAEDVRQAAHAAGKGEAAGAKVGAAVKVTKKYDLFGYVERIPLKGVRKVIANKMVQSLQTAAHVTHMDEADVTHLAEIREKEKKLAEAKGIKLTYLPFVIKAIVKALKDHPKLNASIEDDEVILKKYYNIGIAVDTEDGLIVPVVKGADLKNILEIAAEIVKLVEAAQSRTIDLMDLKGGTFTITNIGSLGGVFATPIINYPESAILLTGKMGDKPIVKDGRIVIRKIMPLSLSFDHRILDGAEAARFMNDVKKYLEDPDMFLIDYK